MTTAPATFSDLYTDLVRRVRNNTSDTVPVEEAKKFLNLALQDMHINGYEKFPWAERHDVLITQPEYTTGTVTVNQGSTSVTGTSTKWNTNNAFGVNNVRAGGKIKFSGSDNVHEVASVASDTSLTLSKMLTDSDISGGDYTYFEDTYSLASDFLRPVNFASFDDDDEIRLLSRTEFRRMFPRNSTTGRIIAATIFDDSFSSNTTRVRKVKFHKPPDSADQIPYTYITNNLAVDSSGTEKTQMTADDDEPIVPLPYRHLLTYFALTQWYRDRQDDDRANAAQAAYTDLLVRAHSDQEIGAPRARFRPQVTPYVRHAVAPYRRGRNRFSIDDKFDAIEDR